MLFLKIIKLNFQSFQILKPKGQRASDQLFDQLYGFAQEECADQEECPSAVEQPIERDKLGEKDQHIVHTLTHKVTLKQAGFAYLECGSVRSKNATNILIKNLLDALFGALSYWLVGFAFAY